MWFLFSLMGAVITGIGQVLVKKGQITLTPLLDNLIAAIIVNAVLVPALLLFGVVDFHVEGAVLLYAFIAAAMYAVFYYIINLGNVSLMVSLINTFPVVTITLAVLYLGEFPNGYQWFGILFVILGIVFISREKIDKRVKTKNKWWIAWGLLGAVAIGVAEFVTKLGTAVVDGFTFTFFVYLMYIPPVLFLLLVDKKGRKFETLKHKAHLIYTILGIFFIETGLIAIALAYQNGLATLVAPIVATHLLITAVLAIIFLKEKLSPLQKTGIVLNLVGISIIGILS